MNHNTPILLATATCALLGFGSTPAACAQAKKTAPQGAAKESHGDPITVDLVVNGRKLRIRVEGNKIHATCEGDELPVERIEKHGRRVVVKDEHAKPLASIYTWEDGLQLWRSSGDGRAAIGVEVGALSRALADHLELDPAKVLYVKRVAKDRAADKAGLRDHDILLQIDGVQPLRQSSLHEILSKKKPGDKLRVKVLRRGKETELDVRCERVAEVPSMVSGKRNLISVPLLGHFFDPRNVKHEWSTPQLEFLFSKDPSGNRRVVEIAGEDVHTYTDALRATRGRDLGLGEKSRGDKSVSEKIDALEKRFDRLEKLLKSMSDRSARTR